MILLIAVGSFAQQPAQPRFQTRLNTIAAQGAAPSTKNYQLELMIQRGEKVARYKMTLSAGSITTELMDRFTEHMEGAPPPTFALNASLTPFEDGAGGELAVSLNRNVAYKGKTQTPQGSSEVILTKSIPLITRVALLPGKAVTIFEDDDEKISFKLTELAGESEK
jgi:hypothetical protein